MYFLILLQQTCFLMAAFWPITLILCAVWLWFLMRTRVQSSGERWSLLGLGCLAPVLVPVGILVCGVIFVHDPSADGDAEPPVYSLFLIWAMLISLLLVAAVVGWRWPANWRAVLASVVLPEFVSWCAAIISGMSITGVWL